jgi:hypothetical protein
MIKNEFVKIKGNIDSLLIDVNTIASKPKVKFLGYILDRNMSPKLHIDALCNKLLYTAKKIRTFNELNRHQKTIL